MNSPVLVCYKVNRIHKVPPHLSCLVSSTLLYCCDTGSWALSCNTVSHIICRVAWVSVTGLEERQEEPQLDCIIKCWSLISEMHSSIINVRLLPLAVLVLAELQMPHTQCINDFRE